MSFGNVRGYGLMIGVELSVPAKKFVTRDEKWLLINCTHETVLRFCQPTSSLSSMSMKASPSWKRCSRLRT